MFSTSMQSSSSQPERSLNRQVVLEEEEYTEALSKIIARDFFPSLVHLDATNGYLDALETRDPRLINASVRRLEEISFTPLASAQGWTGSQTPSRTPFGTGSETPLGPPRGEPAQKRARYDTDMNLDTFQARYTSEDNSSFTQILDEENRVRKEKWAWAWNAQKRVEDQRAKMIENRETLLIEPATVPGVREKFTIEAPKPAGLLTGGDESSKEEHDSNSKIVLRSKDASEEPPLDVMAPQKDKREAGVDGWKFKVFIRRLQCNYALDRSLIHRPVTPLCSPQTRIAHHMTPGLLLIMMEQMPNP